MHTDKLSRIKELREKVLNETLTQEDMIEAITLLREGRVSACFASLGVVKKKVKKVKTTELNADLPF